MKIECGVVGATGYTGLELIKILINHPYFDLVYLGSTKESQVQDTFPSLYGLLTMPIKEFSIEDLKGLDLVFLALPHKSSMEVVKEIVDEGIRVVDLSADYRLDLKNYEKFYCEHIDKKHLNEAVYGLPEIYKKEIENASLVANPGCYPTATLLSLFPFLPYIDENFPIFIDAKSGVSGAGKKCSSKTHYVSINENIHAYNPIKHRHSIEIKEKLFKFSNIDFDINFVPHLIPVTRGMLVSSFFRVKEDIDPYEILNDFYIEERFVRVKRDIVDIKSVSGTNFCDIFATKNGKNIFISSAIDNLLRGASSQAVVNANIMFSLDEDISIPKVAYVP